MEVSTRWSQPARYALAAIRIANGAAALAAPATAARRLGVDPGPQGGALLYVLRLFGIRTVIAGAELIRLRGEALDRVLAGGALMHASDAVAAGLAGFRGQLPARTTRLLVAISTVNVGLALTARSLNRPAPRRT
jgi:hypothetical protein